MGKHPVGFVDDHHAIRSAYEPVYGVGRLGMAELQILDQSLVEIGQQYEPVVVEPTGQKPGLDRVGDEGLIARP